MQLQTRDFGDYTFRPEAAFSSIDEAASVAAADGNSGWDYVFVTTKALPDISDDSASVAPLVGPRTCLVLIQNGVGVEDPFRRRFPRNPIISAVTAVSAEQTSPGVVRQNRWTRISIGPYANGLLSQQTQKSQQDDAEAEALLAEGARRVDSLTRWWTDLGGIRDVEPHDEMGLQEVRWHKLCINAAMNPSAVLCGGRGSADIVTSTSPVDAAEDQPELRRHIEAVMREVWDAAPRVLGRPLDPAHVATPERILRSTERNTGGRPSMLVDWEARKPMELEVILGNPVRIARAKGVDMPRLQSMYALLRSAQDMRKREGKL